MNVGKLFNTLNVRPDDLAKIIRGRGGGGNPWEAYVQDGLAFQLDCTQSAKIEGSEAIITDLAKGIELRGNKDGFWKNDDGSMTIMGFLNESASIALIKGQRCTFEITCKTDSNYGCIGIEGLSFGATNGHNGLYISVDNEGSAAGGVFVAEDNKYWIFYHERKEDSLAMLSGFAYDGSRYYLWDTQHDIGSASTADDPIQGILLRELGSVFSIRIYNRVLSEDERLKNYAIDQKRFVAPPVPENALVDIDGNYIIDAEGNFIVDNN